METTTAVATQEKSAKPQVSDPFKSTISKYLEDRAAEDILFAQTLAKPAKNIDDCITYILNQVKSSGVSGFEDSEIFGMAVHYYDEDDIKPGSRINCKVVVNHTVKLTEEDIQRAKDQAFDQVVAEEKSRLQKKAEQKKDKPAQTQQSLF